MKEVAIKISGMSCQHCVMAVKKALDGLPGISWADVEVGRAKVGFDEAKVSVDDIERAVSKAGYKVVSRWS